MNHETTHQTISLRPGIVGLYWQTIGIWLGHNTEDGLRSMASELQDIQDRIMKLPPLPDSPYLYTEFTSPTARVSNTMYTEAQMRAYGQQCRDAALREALETVHCIALVRVGSALECEAAILELLK